MEGSRDRMRKQGSASGRKQADNRVQADSRKEEKREEEEGQSVKNVMQKKNPGNRRKYRDHEGEKHEK